MSRVKILIVSDTHRKNDNFLKALDRCKPVDMVIHCGDIEGSEYLISEASGCPVEMVAGNNDYFSDLPRERCFTIGKYKVWVTHGHNYYINMENETIKQIARQKGADIVMYGHTHKPVIKVEEDLIIINPGSLTYPRQEGRRPSYILMDIDEKGDANFRLYFL